MSDKTTKTTTKKTKVIGNESYINSSTGEIVDMQVIEVEDRDFNFHKIWLGHVIQALDLVGNKKIKVITHILDNLTRDNIYLGTQRQIAERAGVSVKTVNVTIKSLIESNFLKIETQGAYRINPDVIFSGRMDRRLNILYKYYQIGNDNKKSHPEQSEQLDGQIDIDNIDSNDDNVK